MLTKKELAQELNVSVGTIDNLLKRGVPHIKIGKSVRFELEDVKKWLKSRKENL